MNGDFFSNRRIHSRITASDNIAKSNGVIIDNSKTIGAIEAQFRNSSQQLSNGSNIGQEAISALGALADSTRRDKIPISLFYNSDLSVKIPRLKELVNDQTIASIVEQVVADGIKFDDSGMFCEPINIAAKLNNKHRVIKSISKMTQDNNMVEADYLDAFHNVYSAWGFDDGTTARKLFRQFIVEGTLAWEIIYDDDGKTIKTFKQIDPSTIRPELIEDRSGKRIVYRQYYGGKEISQPLEEDEIIILSYSDLMGSNQVSYVERFLRIANMIRNVEQALVIWHMFNAMPHLKISVSCGKMDQHKAMAHVNSVVSYYQEDIDCDNTTGEMFSYVNKKQPMYKIHAIPMSVEGQETVKIEQQAFEGIDLQNAPFLVFLRNQLKTISFLPKSHFEFDKDGGAYQNGPDNVTNEQKRYFSMEKSHQQMFSTILTKPIYYQMCRNNRLYCKEDRLRNAIGVKMFIDDDFEQRLWMESMIKKAEFVEKMSKVQNNEAGDFPSKFWCQKVGLINPDDDITIKQIKAEKTGASKGDEAQKVADAETGGGGGDMGEGAQGGAPAQGQAQGGAQAQSQPTDSEDGGGADDVGGGAQ